MSLPSTTTANSPHGRLVARLLTTPAPPLALLKHTSPGNTTFMQNIVEDSAVRAHYSDRCVLVSCEDGANAEVAVACLASGLGLAPNDSDIGVILNHLVAHNHTLIILDNVDTIYSSADPALQKATDVLLATLAAVDEVSLVITFCGNSLPECVEWMSMVNFIDGTAKSEPQAVNDSQHVTTHAPEHCTDCNQSSCGPVCASQVDHHPPVPGAAHTVTHGGNPVSTLPASAVVGLDSATKSHRERTPPQISTQPFTLAQSKVLPARPAVFHGRDKELERLASSVTKPNTAPIGIVGPGGIGKTTLAMKVMHEPRVKQHFGRQRFFLTCDGANGVDEVLFNLASKLDVKRSQNEAIWPAILDNLRSRQRVLLLLDNFESIWSPKNDELREESEAFLAQLAVIQELTLLVTTRGNLLPERFTWANIDTAELDTLSSTAARHTFNDLTCLKPHVLESEPEANALTELLREIDFMPLAITLLARLDDLPSGLLREWLEHYTSVLEADHHDGTRRELSVAVSIKISLSHLAAESTDFRPRQLLSVMGHLPAGLFPGVSGSLKSTIPNLDLAAHDLLRHSLVYTGGYGELRMLSPVRHYVSACLPMSAATLSAMDEIYLSLAHASPPAKSIDVDGPAYDVELPNLFHVFAAGLDRRSDSVLTRAIMRLASYCSFRNQSCLPLMQKLMPHVESNASMKAQLLEAISVHYYGKGELNLAAQSVGQSAELYAKSGDKAREAHARGALSALSIILGQSENARQQKARSQALEQELETPDSQYLVMEGESLMLAEQRFRRNREARQLAGDGDAVLKLSDLILDIVKDRGDETAYTKELELVVALYEQTQPAKLIGAMKLLLAQRYINCGRIDGVEDLLIDAYALFSWIDERGTTMALVVSLFGDLHKVQGCFREAADLYEAAGRIFRVAGMTPLAAKYDRSASAMRMHTVTCD